MRLLRGLMSVADELRKYDQPLGSWADVVSRIAGDQSQARIWGVVQDGDVIWLDDLLARDFEIVCTAVPTNLNLIAFSKFVYVPKECIAVR